MATYDDVMGNTSYTLRLIVNQTSQNIEANTSTVSWSLRILRTAGTGRWGSYSCSWSVNIGGQTRSGTISSYDFRLYSELVLGSGTITITHNADGTKTITNTGTFTDPGANIGNGSASGSLALTTIPRASTPSFSAATVDAGTAVTIETNRASASFTHTVRYAIGGASGTIATGVGESTSWTPPLSLLNQIPNSTTGTMTISLDTYSGATLIGTRSAAFTLRAADDVVPTIGSVTATENVSLVATEVGAFVRSLSRLNVAIVGAAGVYGSTITSNTITVDGQVISAASGVTAPLATSGVLPVVGTVVDSRGRSASTTLNVTVLPYAPPSINAPLTLVRRSDNTGVLDEEGTFLRVDLAAAVQSLVVSSVEKNTLTYRVSSRLRGDTTWDVETTVTPGGLTFNSFFVLSGFAIESAWEILIEVYDKFATAPLIATVATANVFMHWADGMGLGKFYEAGRGILDASGQMYQNDGLAVIDAGDLATETVAGIAEIATSAEVLAGTDNGRIVSPAGLASLNLRNGYRQAAPIRYTSSGTFSKAAWVAAGYTHVLVECQAGGGAGGGRTSTSIYGSGGGGGGYVQSIIPLSDLPTSATVTVGAGGTGVSGGTGNTGGTSSFQRNTGTCQATGGVGGILGGDGDGASYGGVGGSGTGDLVVDGGHGGMWIRSTGVFAVTGHGGAAFLGPGARARHNGSSGTGFAPTGGYGGGGGGSAGAATGAGGAGAPGIVIVTPLIGA